MRTQTFLACLIAAVLAFGTLVALAATTVSSGSFGSATTSSALDGNYWT